MICNLLKSHNFLKFGKNFGLIFVDENYLNLHEKIGNYFRDKPILSNENDERQGISDSLQRQRRKYSLCYGSALSTPIDVDTCSVLIRRNISFHNLYSCYTIRTMEVLYYGESLYVLGDSYLKTIHAGKKVTLLLFIENYSPIIISQKIQHFSVHDFEILLYL